MTAPQPFTEVVLITGATSGLGRGLALDLAPRGATLLLHGRDPDRLAALASDLREAAPDAVVRTYPADLADLDDVRALGERVAAAEPRLGVLVNNAAVGFGADPSLRETSAQGHELRFAVNHLAPHLLTALLTPLLVASAPARVVNVASIGQAPLDFDDLAMTGSYEGTPAYRRAKLAMIMSTFDLAERLRPTGVTVNALHPATLMDTTMVRDAGISPRSTLEDGLRPTARLVVDPALATVTGRYFDRFADTRAHEQAYDPEARARLAAATAALLA